MFLPDVPTFRTGSCSTTGGNITASNFFVTCSTARAPSDVDPDDVDDEALAI